MGDLRWFGKGQGCPVCIVRLLVDNDKLEKASWNVNEYH